MNPVIFMVLLGCVWNAIFNIHLGFQSLADVSMFLDTFLSLLGNIFSGTALFVLGMTSIGRFKTLHGRYLIRPLFLVFMKHLV